MLWIAAFGCSASLGGLVMLDHAGEDPAASADSDASHTLRIPLLLLAAAAGGGILLKARHRRS